MFSESQRLHGAGNGLQDLRNVEIHRSIPDWKLAREDNRVQELVRSLQKHVATSVALDIVKDEFVDRCTYQKPWPGCQTSWRRATHPAEVLAREGYTCNVSDSAAMELRLLVLIGRKAGP